MHIYTESHVPHALWAPELPLDIVPILISACSHNEPHWFQVKDFRNKEQHSPTSNQHGTHLGYVPQLLKMNGHLISKSLPLSKAQAALHSAFADIHSTSVKLNL